MEENYSINSDQEVSLKGKKILIVSFILHHLIVGTLQF